MPINAHLLPLSDSRPKAGKELKSLINQTWAGLMLLLLMMLASFQVQAGSPYLWQLENQNGTQSYLFGTIHSAHPELNQLPGSVVDSFTRADAYFGELDMSPATLSKATQLFMAPGNHSLQQTLSPERQRRINAVLNNIQPGLSLALFSRFKLWAFTTTLAVLEDQVRHGQSAPMDMRLFQQAAATGKQLGGLETIEQQAGVFSAFSETENLLLLDATLDYMEQAQRNNQSVMEDSYQAYRSGDPESFSNLMRSQMALPPLLAQKLERHLLRDRNHRMAERISELLGRHPQRSFFFAVGAAHYSGHDGLQNLLRHRGYRVTRIYQ